MSETLRKEGWLQRQMKSCSLWVKAHHKLQHLTEEELTTFIGDWEPPIDDNCAWSDAAYKREREWRGQR